MSRKKRSEEGEIAVSEASKKPSLRWDVISTAAITLSTVAVAIFAWRTYEVQKKTERPWISPYKINPPSTTMALNFELINSGRSPALQLGVVVEVVPGTPQFVPKSSTELDQQFANTSGPLEESMLGATCVLSEGRKTDRLAPAVLSALQNDEPVVANVTARYRDTLNNVHYTTFSLCYEGKYAPLWRSCGHSTAN